MSSTFYVFLINVTITYIMTTKQDKALKNLQENGGNVKRAMLDAGYTAYSANTGAITRSKAYKDLMKQHGVSHEQYFKNIGDAMTATKTFVIGKGDDAFIDERPDHPVRLNANKQAERFLFNDGNTGDDSIKPGSKIDNASVLEAIKRGDKVTLSQAVFNSGDDK